MRKIRTTLLVFMFVLFACINVKASEYYEVRATLEKGESSRALYNSMPTEVRKGDIISVKLYLENGADWKFSQVNSVIDWDKEAFELVETNGKYYTILNDEMVYYRQSFVEENSIRFIVGPSEATMVLINKLPLVEYKFKVKNDAKDGIYQINLREKEDGIAVYDINDNLFSTYIYDQTLKYQVGKSKIKSFYTKSDIENIDETRDVYVIGSHVFTRNTNDEYNGELSTDYIMLAAKSIESNDKSDMIIYLKNLFGDWKNAITNTAITPPDEFKIEYIDMKANYAKNGIYASSGDKTILRLIQINEQEAIVTIENDMEILHGLAIVNGNAISLSIGGKKYGITIANDTASISVSNGSDSYLTETNLTRVANVSINDYYNEAYSVPYYYGDGSDEVPTSYLSSSHNAMYVSGNHEVYLLRDSDSVAKLCIKQKGEPLCEIEQYVYNISDMDFYREHDDNEENPDYMFYGEDLEYGIYLTDGQMEISCLRGLCHDGYTKTYTKEKKLTMEDAFHVWEKNEVKYRVALKEDANEDPYLNIYAVAGSTLNTYENNVHYFEPDKDNAYFVGWKENGQDFDLDTPITKPITLVAVFRELPGAPSLSIVKPDGVEHDYYEYSNDRFYYHLAIDLEGEYDGFGIYEESNPFMTIISAPKGEMATVSVATDNTKKYYAEAYIEVNGERLYGRSSTSPVTINPHVYTVTFDSNGGSFVASQTVPEESLVTRPDDPIRSTLYEFVRWEYNNEEFNFNTIIKSNITLVAKWRNTLAVPEIGSGQTNSYYTYGIYLANPEDYCSSVVGCENYKIDGFEIFKTGDNNPIGINENGIHKTQFGVNETVEINQAPNTTGHYYIRAFKREGAVFVYSENSEEIVINTAIPTPMIAFDSTAGTPNPANEVETWITISNLMDDYCYIFDENDNCASYKVTGFEVWKKVGNEYSSLDGSDAGDPLHVVAHYGEELHLYVTAYYTYNGQPVHSGYSSELVLYVPAPTPSYACYYDGSTTYTWTSSPQSGWIEVQGVNNAADCHAPAPACYLDGAGELYHWTSYPDASWTEMTSMTTEADCHAPAPACYLDGAGELYHWTSYPDASWTEMTSMTTEADCHAPSTGNICYADANGLHHWTNSPEAGWEEVEDDNITNEVMCLTQCYVNKDTFESDWTNTPNPGWQLFPAATDENTCSF